MWLYITDLTTAYTKPFAVYNTMDGLYPVNWCWQELDNPYSSAIGVQNDAAVFVMATPNQ